MQYARMKTMQEQFQSNLKASFEWAPSVCSICDKAFLHSWYIVLLVASDVDVVQKLITLLVLTCAVAREQVQAIYW